MIENEVIKLILSKLTKEEKVTLINNVMQYKADADVKEGWLKEAFTPMYQVSEYLKISEPSVYELRSLVMEKVYENKFQTNYDGATIMYAKQVARKYKVRYQDILSGMRPRGTIDTQVWDENGKIVPYKKIFY